MNRRALRIRLGCLLAIGIPAAIVLILIVAAVKSPAFAAEGADLLRGLLGDKIVARLESVAFTIEDQINQWEYSLGWKKPSLPAPPLAYISTPTASTEPPPLTPTPARTESAPTATSSIQTKSPLSTALPPPATPTPTSPPARWPPPNLAPLGDLSGEGIWTTYIQNSTGQVVSYLTYLQPDPSRPYSVVAVVAFDLTRTRLHFVLGSVQPYNPNSPKRSGSMDPADRAPGVLLAMFNGGFKAAHGYFGAMAGGVVALPPRDGLGTVAIYTDGRVRMGVWGQDMQATSDMVAWRQNGPPVIHLGQVNPQINNSNPADWGYTVETYSPTWRSGIGLSADGNTLYYFAGSALTMEPLAKVMSAAGAAEAIQLDINAYWVHFVAVRTDGKKLTLEPLFPDSMNENIDRYLYSYTRDYFYVTAAP